MLRNRPANKFSDIVDSRVVFWAQRLLKQLMIRTKKGPVRCFSKYGPSFVGYLE